jgi:hypothetical protein
MRWCVVCLAVAACSGPTGGTIGARESLYASARLDLRTRDGRVAIVDLWGEDPDSLPEGDVLRLGIRVENQGRDRVTLAPARLEAYAGARRVSATLLDAVGAFTPFVTRRLTLSFQLPAGVRAADVDRICLTWGFSDQRRELVSEVSPFVRRGDRFLFTPSTLACDRAAATEYRVYNHAYYRSDPELE